MSTAILRRLTISLGGLLLAACSATPNIVFSPPLQDQWRTELPQQVRVEAGSLADWWQSIEDPVLHRLVALTLQHNPDMENARINYRLAALQLDTATATYLPSLGLSTGVSRAGSKDELTTGYSGGISASWEIDLWGSANASKRSAQAGVAEAEAQMQDAWISLLAQTASAYVNLRLAEENMAVARANIDIRQHSYDIARWENASGLNTELEVMQAKTLLEQTQATLPQFLQAKNEAMNSLWALTGGELKTLLPTLDQFDQLPGLPTGFTLALPAETLRQRPDVRVQEYRVRQQVEALHSAHNQRLPSLSLRGSLSGSDEHYADVFNPDAMVRSLAASLSYTLFDAGELKTNERRQQLQLDATLNSYRNTLLNAQREVENALAALASAQQQQQSYDQAEQSARLAEELAQMQYDAGILDFSDLLDTQSQLLNSKNARVQNAGALLISWIQLYRAAGGGWQHFSDLSTPITE